MQEISLIQHFMGDKHLVDQSVNCCLQNALKITYVIVHMLFKRVSLACNLKPKLKRGRKSNGSEGLVVERRGGEGTFSNYTCEVDASGSSNDCAIMMSHAVFGRL